MKTGAYIATIMVVTAIAVQCPQHAVATPAEVYVGFPLLRGEGASQLFGVHAAVTDRLGNWIGVVGEGAVHVGETVAEKSLWTVLAGPVVSVGSKVRPFGQARLGTAISPCGRFDNGCGTAAVFAGAYGGGVDFRPGSGVAYRAQVDQFITRFGGGSQHFLRLSFGVVFGRTR